MRTMLADIYLWLKAAHLIAVVGWMAGMMYLPRLFIYHAQAIEKGEATSAATFVVMERRLLRGIMNPALVVTWLLGLTMVFTNTGLLSEPWLHVKILSVLGITFAHGYYAWARKRFEAGTTPNSTRFWRIMNEAPFILFIVIVVMVIVRPF